MTILRKTTSTKRNEDVCFIGIYIPKEMASYISLYSLSTGKTKSSILKKLLIEWISKKQKRLPLEKIINNTGKRAFEIWNNPKGARTHFNTFKNELRIELKNRGSERYTDEILNIIANEKNKENG